MTPKPHKRWATCPFCKMRHKVRPDGLFAFHTIRSSVKARRKCLGSDKRPQPGTITSSYLLP